jgi:membrane fusion protein, multidrug efflux system
MFSRPLILRHSVRLLCACSALLLLSATPLPAQETQGLVFPVKSVSVSSPVLQEVIDSVQVEEGNEVTEGQVLVQLRKDKEELVVQEAERLVETAQFVSKGMQSLFDQKMGSKDQALKAQTDEARAKIQLQIAKVQLKEKTVTAPLSGIVVKKYKEAGESVDRVEKLIDIVNIDQVYVQFYLDPKLLSSLQVNQPVTVRINNLGEAGFTGKIDFIDPRIDASSGLFRVKVLIENKDHKIKAGMRAMADFTKASRA